MTSSDAGFTGTEIRPIGATETLGKDGPACNFSVIRQKGDSLSCGAPRTISKQHAGRQPENR